MPEFDYQALDVAGRERRGRIRAEAIEAARVELAQRRLYVVALAPGDPDDAGPALLSRRAWIGRRLTPRQRALFTRQLATLARVTPLEQALNTIARQTEQPQPRAIFAHVHAAVREGRTLADALAQESDSFSPLYRAMVAAGESAGTLPAILDRLAVLLERQALVRGKVLGALAYPLALALVAIAVVTGLMLFVIPKVVAQFEDIGQQLPLLTRMVIGLSNALAQGWWLIVLALLASGMLAGWLLRKDRYRFAFDRGLLRLPLLGRLIRDLHAARMARTLGAMVAARVPLLEGLRLTRRTIRNHALAAASDAMIEGIRTGSSLSNAMQRTRLFPPLLVYLAASGEASGQLDAMLERAAEYLEREFDVYTGTALALLEPAIIVLMGGIVALIVLSILLPILQLDTLAAGL